DHCVFHIRPYRLVPLSASAPVATTTLCDAATLLSKSLVSLTRGVQFVPFGLLRIVPLSPVTKYKSRKTPTPCKSLVVGRAWTAYQTTPNVLTVWLVTMPSMFVTVTLVSAYGL